MRMRKTFLFFLFMPSGASRSARAPARTVLSPVLAVLLAALASAAPTVAGAEQVYKYLDRGGRVLFTDRPPQDKGMRLAGVWTWKGWRLSQWDASRWRRNRARFLQPIDDTALQHGVSRALLHAVIDAESGYDPHAVSSAGAVGLMQLMPLTARRYGVSDRRDPFQNLQGGTRYLRDLIALFGGDLTLAVAAYNAGENAVIRYGRTVPPYRETQRYVGKVLGSYRKLRLQYPDPLVGNQ